MAVTYEAFLVRFPEFTPGGTNEQKARTEAVIREELARAPRHVNATIWGDQADDGIAYLTAHRVVTRPGGTFARGIATPSKDGTTTYGREYDRMRGMLLVGDRVI